MKNKKINSKCPYRVIVAAVSYLNTIPFIWGIQRATLGLCEGESIELILEVPSKCAELAVNGQVDIALVPIAEIPNVKNGKIITDFCLSAEGNVETVALLCNNSNLSSIKTIYLDCDSKTSVQLAKVLAKHKWKIYPDWKNGIPTRLEENEAIIAIGDKVFEMQKNFSTKKDLAHEWIAMTGLPFVFAAWVGCTEKGLQTADKLNRALEFGVGNIGNAIKAYAPNNPHALDYLTKNIKFHLSSQKLKAMKLFWDYVNPG